jgi:Zn-dependent protease
VAFRLGGVPLPGGATYIRHDLLRSRWWDTAVSLAGPAMNLLLFLILAVALHPKTGWVPMDLPATEWSNAQRLAAALMSLQIISVMLNLIPIPPLDGFGAISPHLNSATRERLLTPPLPMLFLVGLFMLLGAGGVFVKFLEASEAILELLGYDDYRLGQIRRSFNFTVFSRSW